jgi:hypothetical protein
MQSKALSPSIPATLDGAVPGLHDEAIASCSVAEDDYFVISRIRN